MMGDGPIGHIPSMLASLHAKHAAEAAREAARTEEQPAGNLCPALHPIPFRGATCEACLAAMTPEPVADEPPGAGRACHFCKGPPGSCPLCAAAAPRSVADLTDDEIADAVAGRR